jgi:hypothetical protein
MISRFYAQVSTWTGTPKRYRHGYNCSIRIDLDSNRPLVPIVF